MDISPKHTQNPDSEHALNPEPERALDHQSECALDPYLSMPSTINLSVP